MTKKPVLTLDQPGLALQKRHMDWWQRKQALCTFVEGAPLGDLWLPLSDGTIATEDVALTPELIDLDRVAGPNQAPGPLAIYGDLFSVADPYGRVPWVEAILGAPIHATIKGGSMRTLASIDSFEQWERQASHRDERWFGLLMQLTELLVSRSAGRFAVVQPTMRGPSDLAEAILGPVLMSYAMYDEPQHLEHFLDQVTDVFIGILHALLEHIAPVNGGYLSPFGIWAPGSVVRTQCDATAFLSAKQYTSWYLPHDLAICKSVDYSFIHLHSISLHTVDALLAQELPRAIQITLEAEPKGPSLAALLPVLRRILEVKPLLVEGQLSADQVAWLQDQLPSGGLAITARRSAW
ncbi:MAG TPA: hypothetical protein VGK81_12590 [Anaerolineae bacterium]